MPAVGAVGALDEMRCRRSGGEGACLAAQAGAGSGLSDLPAKTWLHAVAAFSCTQSVAAHQHLSKQRIFVEYVLLAGVNDGKLYRMPLGWG